MDQIYQKLLSQLEIEQALLRTVVDQLPCAVVIAEVPSGRLLLGNRQLEEIWRHPFYSADNIEEYRHWRGFHADGRPYDSHEWPLARTIRTGQTIIEEEIRILRGDESNATILVSTAPLRNRDGQIIASVAIIHDITEAKQVEAERMQLLEREHAARMRAERMAKRMQRLQMITARLAETITLDQVADVILRQTEEAFQLEAGAIALLNEEGTQFQLLRTVGYSSAIEEQFKSFPANAPLPLADALRLGRPIVLASLEERRAVYPHMEGTRSGLGDGALVALPLLAYGQALGSLGLVFAEPRTFAEDDLDFLTALAEQCAQALDRARLYEAERLARSRAERMLACTAQLQQVTAALAEARTSAAVAAATIAATAAFGAAAAAVAVPSMNEESLEVIAAYGYPEEVLRAGQRLPLSVLVAVKESLRVGNPLWLDSQEQWAERYPDLTALQAQAGDQAFALLPLTLDGRPIGILHLSFTGDTRALAEKRPYLHMMAQQVAQALDRAYLYESESHARQAAEAAVQLRDQFFSIAAHELKTPVTAIMGYAQLLQRRLANDARLGLRNQHALASLSHQTARLQRLVDSMLDLSRIQSGRLSLDPQVLELNALVYKLLDEIRPMFPAHILKAADAAQTLIIRGDALRIEQATYNLIQNAVKYSPPGSTISIRLSRIAQEACIEVHDEGIGIPSASIPHIFSLFYRADNINPHEIAGIGLGLFVVKEVVTLHDGKIEVSSTEGQGSTFCVYLPLHAEG